MSERLYLAIVRAAYMLAWAIRWHGQNPNWSTTIPDAGGKWTKQSGVR